MRTMLRAKEPVEIFNRYTGRIEREPIYGERWLRWTYETVPGRMMLALAIRRAWFSRFYGRRMCRPSSARRIAPFIARYRLNADEFAQPPESFESFNAFFTRRLKESARPVCAEPGAVVFPADGRHLGFADVGATTRFYAKGQELGLYKLFDDGALAQWFEHGSLVISRLCPTDYHRFHYPCAGRMAPGWPVGDRLHSVNPIALRRSLRYLTENKRVISLLDTDDHGVVAMVEIGATCVGGIVYTKNNGPVKAGEEKGYFQFGGSCVITLFGPRHVQLDADLLAQSALGRELYARMGDRMGVASRP